MKKNLRMLAVIFVIAFSLLVSSFSCQKKDAVHTCTIKIHNLHLHTELAISGETRATGLMYRKYLPARHAMLFIFEQPREAAMWMKNTYIPLDMAFADHQGKIVWIHNNAAPESETIIRPDQPSKYVLEVNAGELTRHDIKPGDALDFSGCPL